MVEANAGGNVYQDPPVLRTLVRLLTRCAKPRVLVHGPAGIGKTALLNRVRQKWSQGGELKRWFPDGMIYIHIGRGPLDDQGHHAHLISKLKLLESTLDTDPTSSSSTLGTPPRLQDIGLQQDADAQDLEGVLFDQICKIRALLVDGKQRLVILDDIWPAQEHLFTRGGLIPSTNGLTGGMLMASRVNMSERFEGRVDAVKVELDELDCESILALNTYRDPEQSFLRWEHQTWGHKLLSKCGSQPLMIRMVGHLLQKSMRGRDWHVHVDGWRRVYVDLAAQLQSMHGHDLDDYTKPLDAYENSVRDLDVGGKRLLSILAWFPAAEVLPVGPVLAVWVALTGQSTGFRDELLKLEQVSVVEVLQEAGPIGMDQVRMHTMLRIHLDRTSDPRLQALPLAQIAPPAPDNVDAASPDAIFTAQAAALSAIALYSDSKHSQSIRQQMQTLVQNIPGVAPSKWWEQCTTFDCNANTVACALQLAHTRGPADVAAVQQLVVSAAAQRLWPGMQAHVAHLLGDLDTAQVALAFIAGSSLDAQNGGWVEAYTESCSSLIAHAGTNLLRCDQLMAIAVVLTRLARRQEALQLTEHVHKVWTRQLGRQQPKTIDAKHAIGNLKLELGQYAEAAEVQEEVVADLEQLYGPQESSTLLSMVSLGLALEGLGRYQEALELQQRALAGYEATLGAHHPDALYTMLAVGVNLACLGRYEEALQIQHRALLGCQRSLGPRHRDTLRAIRMVGGNLASLGRFKEALVIQQRALAGYKALLGVSHPSTLRALRNVGVTLDSLGRYEEALVVHEQVVAGHEAVLGAEHPNTLGSLLSLAGTLSNLGRYQEALETQQRALEGCTAAQGSMHPSTLGAMLSVGATLSNLGLYEEALELQRQSLAGYETALGPQHPDTLAARHGMGWTLTCLGRYEEALAVQREVAAGYEATLGSGHPDTLSAKNNLAATLFWTGKFRDSLSLHERTLQAYEDALGHKHPDTLLSKLNVGECLQRLGRLSEAQEVLAPVVSALRSELGESHAWTLLARCILGNTLRELSCLEEALELLQETKETAQRAYGADHPAALRCMHALGEVLAACGRHDEAVAGQLDTWQRCQKVLGAKHPETLRGMLNLGTTLKELDRLDEATEMITGAKAGLVDALGTEHPDTVRAVSCAQGL